MLLRRILGYDAASRNGRGDEPYFINQVLQKIITKLVMRGKQWIKKKTL